MRRNRNATPAVSAQFSRQLENAWLLSIVSVKSFFLSNKESLKLAEYFEEFLSNMKYSIIEYFINNVEKTLFIFVIEKNGYNININIYV